MSDQAAPTVIPARNPAKTPPDVEQRVRRGHNQMRQDAPKRRLCMRFERGDTYWYLTDQNNLNSQATVTSATGGGKPPHRIRNRLNFIRPIVQGKVSQATQRVPGYDIAPTSTDPERVNAARLATRVALFGYDRWDIGRVTKKVALLAIGHGGDGFAIPYFDTAIGPYVPVENPETGEVRYVGQGEVNILVLSGNEVFWEPGVDFMQSRWHCTERAEPVEEVMRRPGFFGEKLTADASTSDIPTDRPGGENLVMVTEYYERPCPKYPEGRRITLANGRPVINYKLVDDRSEYWWEPYPLRGPDGKVVDEPVPIRLTYNLDPETDRDFGLTWQLIDPQRSAQDCINKMLEWKNRCLNPRMLAPIDSLITRPNDTPGGVDLYRPVLGGQVKPEWEQPPPIPDSLFKLLDYTREVMRDIASDEQLEAQANVAARTVSAVIEQSQARWASFLAEMAVFHSRLMRHCLALVARYYTEPRLLTIRGRNGWEHIPDFKGADLLSEIDVRVAPGSLEYLTKEAVTQRAIAYLDRGLATPQHVMVAIEQGTTDNLVQSIVLDQARAHRILERVREGTAMDMPPRVELEPVTDPVTGVAQTQMVDVPGWMPEKGVDNLDVWQQEFSDYAKTEDFENLPADRQEIVRLVIKGIADLRQQEAVQAAQMQSLQAEQLGMGNAAKPQMTKPLPDQMSPVPEPDRGAAPPAV